MKMMMMMKILMMLKSQKTGRVLVHARVVESSEADLLQSVRQVELHFLLPAPREVPFQRGVSMATQDRQVVDRHYSSLRLVVVAQSMGDHSDLRALRRTSP